jgi:hypothetical protein
MVNKKKVKPESAENRMQDDLETPSDVHERFTSEDPLEAAERRIARQKQQ